MDRARHAADKLASLVHVCENFTSGLFLSRPLPSVPLSGSLSRAGQIQASDGAGGAISGLSEDLIRLICGAFTLSAQACLLSCDWLVRAIFLFFLSSPRAFNPKNRKWGERPKKDGLTDDILMFWVKS